MIRGRPSPVPMVLVAFAVLGALWFVRRRLAAPLPAAAVSLDGAAYLRVVGPTLRTAGCASTACHGGAARPRLTPSLDDAADAIREYHDVSQRASKLYRYAIDGAHAGQRALSPRSCEAEALRAWTERRPVRDCVTRSR